MNQLQDALLEARIKEKVIASQKESRKSKNLLNPKRFIEMLFKVLRSIGQPYKRLKKEAGTFFRRMHLHLTKPRSGKIQEGIPKDIENTFSILENYTMANLDQKRSEIKMNKNLILWDIENISHNFIDVILEKAQDTGQIYCVSARPLSQSQTDKLFPYIVLFGIRVIVDHNDSDEEIKRLAWKHYIRYRRITIVSSDSDFVQTIRKLLQKGKQVDVIAKDKTKKRMMMKVKLDHENLTVKTVKSYEKAI